MGSTRMVGSEYQTLTYIKLRYVYYHYHHIRFSVPYRAAKEFKREQSVVKMVRNLRTFHVTNSISQHRYKHVIRGFNVRKRQNHHRRVRIIKYYYYYYLITLL